ncbi:MAG TPA: molecular chaperone TorD family protein [Holophaga sp.]|nr:molecular chaperone TorD family protein [Holophaga sp.]
MAATLPDLLEALGGVFVLPGAPGWDPAPFLEAPWAPGELRTALAGMVPGPDLDVAYAGLFIAGRDRAPIRLELSALTAGRLRDETLLASLDAAWRAAGLEPAGVSADHLGALLGLLAHLLRMAEDPACEILARHLLQDRLEPLASHVAEGLAAPGTGPFHAAAGRVLVQALALCRTLLA